MFLPLSRHMTLGKVVKLLGFFSRLLNGTHSLCLISKTVVKIKWENSKKCKLVLFPFPHFDCSIPPSSLPTLQAHELGHWLCFFPNQPHYAGVGGKVVTPIVKNDALALASMAQ